ncbi:response regulator transcription factor [Alkalihalobacillus sp. LMS39]|uniref:response regulator transcription factor n=1 Tax=Alkalihalobacillus sp. LMS39 TaxID=2924032 RepID=UPI001FB52079|nr:response regulator transcription factor [Alkalihalobacillus sp. LMS39]UOE96418.1 response regulator transcription factor [Alkalihalobacillus sp. LMS39]
MDKERILIVEDEVNIARVVKLELEYEGYETDIAENGLEAWQKLQKETWDLVLLDVMLPQLSGMEVLRRLRGAGDLTPVIMLTARNTVVDKVTGLDQGANDYVTKPFEIEELLARIRTSIRFSVRKEQESNETQLLSFQDLQVNIGSRDIQRNGVNIELTPREFDLLIYLLQHPNQVLTREQIVDKVWGFDYVGDTNVVDVYIRYLRQKIDKPFTSPYIQTVRGVGYVLKELES